MCRPQFFWCQTQALDLEKFLDIFHKLPVEELLAFLQSKRKKGRNDYPIPEMWEYVYKRFIFSRLPLENSSASALSRFLKLLEVNRELIVNMLYRQIKSLYLDLDLHRKHFIVDFLETDNSNLRYHYVLEATYGIPLALRVEKKSDDLLVGAYLLLEELDGIGLFHDRTVLIGNAYYDNSSFIAKLWDQYRIKAVIPLEKDPPMDYSFPFPKKNICYSSKGEIFCVIPFTGKKQAMVYCGFEQNRESLKFSCPSKYYGVDCEGKTLCQGSSGVRVPMRLDRRLFLPIPRSSCQFDILYKKSVISRFFSSYLSTFKNGIKMYEHSKKDLLCLLLRSFLYASIEEVLKKRRPI